MKSSLKVVLLQYDVIWNNLEVNLEKIMLLLGSVRQKIDIIILPEMFATGFTLRPKLLTEGNENFIIEKLKEISENYNACVIGSHPCKSDNSYYNRLLILKDQHTVLTYDKKHLFKKTGEDKQYYPGSEQVVFDYQGWKILPLICYDLRFPVWSRNTMNYDLLVYSANWPAVRNHIWETLLNARAIENQCYVCGVNRTGEDKNRIKYIGNSRVINYKGEILKKLDNKESVLITELKMKELKEFRAQFPFLEDADKFRFI
ncbi:MAG: amidohydrolase [Bacteroidales bacterium]|nr:amidohydrolase [Bacteroidales bacterium]